MKIHRQFTVHRTPEDLYRFWRQMQNLAPLAPGDTVVTEKDQRTSHWVARGPGGREFAWDARITVDEPGREIAWQSEPGGDVKNSGSVRFEIVADRETRISLDLEFTPPAGLAGKLAAFLVHQHIESEIDAGLDRVKQRLRTNASP